MKLACITGASSGIGKEFAYLLSDLEYDLILVGRNSAALHEIADNVAVRCKCITCDLSDEKSCVKLGKKLRKYPLETKLKNDINMINVNIKAVHILTKAVLPGFIQRDRGYIMNVASSAGLLPGGPYMSTYYATKAYVTSLTTAIHGELRDLKSNVHISMLCPGPVDTNFNNVANVKFALSGIPADYCAYYALCKMFTGKLTLVPTFTMKAGIFGSRFLPRQELAIMTGHQQKKKTDNI